MRGELKNGLSSLAFILCFSVGDLRLDAEELYSEAGGLVIVEAESSRSPLGLQHQKSLLSGHTGSGYLEFTGNT